MHALPAIAGYYDPLLTPVRREPEFSHLLKDIGFV
jgi:hypothetical protein